MLRKVMSVLSCILQLETVSSVTWVRRIEHRTLRMVMSVLSCILQLSTVSSATWMPWEYPQPLAVNDASPERDWFNLHHRCASLASTVQTCHDHLARFARFIPRSLLFYRAHIVYAADSCSFLPYILPVGLLRFVLVLA